MQKGSISVQTENIFPIIKKFLYSDQEIFLRELISNAVDATSKLKTLSSKGEFKGEVGDTTIEIILDKEAKTLTIRDKGIGMTQDEVEKYLNQVAFSSAQEFLEKYQNESSIIGHFGLGFYSAFMVASKVEAVTRSYKDDAQGVTWSCEGDPEYMIVENDKTARGTDMVLHISDESSEFLEEGRIQGLLNKYCRFLPVQIQFGTKKETIWEGEGDDKESKEIEVDNIINDTKPAWKKTPSELTDDDYKNFYNQLYPFSQPPMFWIHLNIDYPFNLTGILYFPKLNNSLELQKNKIQLYSNQVYVTDDVKEIVPEFLTLLHGVIDSPDIPLNVSRSYLQSDSNVRKITGYITKKVAEKLNELFKNDRSDFEAKWKDLGVFVKYGMISDEKFNDRAQKYTLLKNVEGAHFTIEEYKEKVKASQTDKHDKIILLYTNNEQEHHSYIVAAKNKGYDVLEFDNPMIDNHFMQHLEHKVGEVTFVRVDSDTVDNLVQKDEKNESVLSEKEEEKIKGLFEGVVKEKEAIGVTVMLTPLTPEDHPVFITKPEFMRRMKEMQAMSGGMGMGDFPDTYNLVVNTNNPLIADKLLKMRKEDKKTEFVNYLFNLALLNQNMLKGKDLSSFINKSLEFLHN
ncbi:MAG: molecular chaperone HtpG [Bacteroidetes bacterium]|jgi:molecular chaperone HtpG|nr:molecular chaperone HtpG [Bacteroidota bacterium]